MLRWLSPLNWNLTTMLRHGIQFYFECRFRIRPSYNVPELMEVFRNLEKLKILGIFDPWRSQFWPQRKFDWNSFVIIFDELSNVFSRFSIRPVGAELDGGGGGGFNPPPSRWWKSWSASGARVNTRGMKETTLFGFQKVWGKVFSWSCPAHYCHPTHCWCCPTRAAKSNSIK